ncbi:MAG: hypothetical protein IJ920_05145 [Paludibacteraceae bacterium]|nr:hypothetical protein [Paludibacteraceae bacterium]
MKPKLLKYVVVVLAMIASTGLLWADTIVGRDSIHKANDTIIVDTVETKLIPFGTSELAIEADLKQNDESNREWWIALISAFVGAIFGYLLTLLNESRQARKRKEQFVKEIQLLTGAVLKHTKGCNNAIVDYINNVKSTPHEIHDLQQGILVAIERITRLDATMVYEAFESKGKQDDFDNFLNLTDQLLTAYSYAYKDYEDHNDEIVKATNEFEDIAASVMYDCQPLSVNPVINNILTKYVSTHQGNNQNSIDIKLEYNTLIFPVKTYLGQNDQVPIDELWKKVDKADYLYHSICGHQLRFAAHLEQRLLYINQTIQAIEKVKL